LPLTEITPLKSVGPVAELLWLLNADWLLRAG